VANSDNFSIVSKARKMQVTLEEKPQKKVISFQQTKTWISNLSG